MIEAKLVQRITPICANVFPIVAPANPPVPCVVYQQIGFDPTRDISDDEQTEGFKDFQIDVYSTRFLEAKQVARAIKISLKEWDDDDIGSVAWTNELNWADSTTDVYYYRVTMHFTFYDRAI